MRGPLRLLSALVLVGLGFLAARLWDGADRPAMPGAAGGEKGEGLAAMAPFDRLARLETRSIVPPQRRNKDRTPGRRTPAPGAFAGKPFEIHYRVRTGAGRNRVEARLRIVRTPRRILLDGGADRCGWLFCRNPVDPTRVFALRIDTRRRLLIDYTEADLRMHGMSDGWADLVTCGAAGAVAGMRKTEKSRRAFGAVFRYYETAKDGDAGIAGLWWSGTLGIPLLVEGRSRAGRPYRVELTGLLPNPKAPTEGELVRRHPDFRRVDLADLEDLDG